MQLTITNAHRFLQLLERMRHQRAGPALERLGALGLTHSHMRLLRMLAPDHKLAMKEIADRLQLTPPSVTALTRRLVATGLIERRHHVDDSRVVLLSLTDAGRDLHQQLYHEQLQAMANLLAGLSDEEQQLFLDLLDRAVTFASGGSPDRKCPQSRYLAET
ncbi:MarR family transcriptional regulator [Oscillochloris sp. ZM17-4]|uniref:MarR family winged helix-turn-helix transcriptional regulator n=1 Tax=Oscillochloris sp. ZM17-4 TaxID=2866714 RepID=UPI001C7337CC|nr:MarR family transcriptional regulator [Oscillochloris sp. ZM17-4]MBX0329528.1 MarR family transcriptional regulator [Oscillochloris sp. ZM17-4]